MPFRNTKTPKKPKDNSKQKYVVPMKRCSSGAMTYYLTPELEEVFCRLYPITMNPDLMEMFGISFSTLQRFKRAYKLCKNKKVILKKHAAQIKRINRESGYYASLKGKRPCPQCFEAYRRKLEEGWYPLKNEKEGNTVRYRHLMKKRGEMRKELIRKEKRRYDLCMVPLTNIPTHLYAGCAYSRQEVTVRNRAKKFGYILGSIDPDLGERHIIFYTDETKRRPLFESGVAKTLQFSFVKYKQPKQ